MKAKIPDRDCKISAGISKKLYVQLDYRRKKLGYSNMSDYIRILLSEFKQIDLKKRMD